MCDLGTVCAYSSAFEVAFAANLIAVALFNIVKVFDSEELASIRENDQKASALDGRNRSAIGRAWFWSRVSKGVRYLRRACWHAGFAACLIGTITFFLVLWHVPPNITIPPFGASKFDLWSLQWLMLIAHLGPTLMLATVLFGLYNKVVITLSNRLIRDEVDTWAKKYERDPPT